LTWFDRRGNAIATIGDEGQYTDFRLSPDERWVALSAVDIKTSTPDIWLADLERGVISRFTFGPILNTSVLWSHDGKKLLYRANRQGSAIGLYEQSANGTGQVREVLGFERAKAAGIQSFAYMPSDSSPDT
jgi:Tol biopolymer transport system component